MSHEVLEFERIGLALGVATVGAATDLRSRRIPNVLTGPAMLAGLLLHGVAGGWRAAGSSLGALVACGAVFLLFHLAGGMGAGDVKLIAAEGALLGWTDVLPLLTYTALAGGAMAFAVAAANGRLRQTMWNVADIMNHHGRRGLEPHPELHVRNEATLRLPYAVAIAAGVALTVVLARLALGIGGAA